MYKQADGCYTAQEALEENFSRKIIIENSF